MHPDASDKKANGEYRRRVAGGEKINPKDSDKEHAGCEERDEKKQTVKQQDMVSMTLYCTGR